MKLTTNYLGIFAFLAIAPNLQAQESKVDKTGKEWAVTTTAFKIYGETSVRNVKLNWMERSDANLYKIYRDGKLIGEARGNTYDDYALPIGKTFVYTVDAYKDKSKIATSLSQAASSFSSQGKVDIYDNSKGKYISQNLNNPSGFKIGNTYYSYRAEQSEKDGKKGWKITERLSKTGLKDSWGEEREVAFYPNIKFEGIGFRFNPKTQKVVFSAHYEDANGYTAAKIFLAQITAKGTIEVGIQDRPLGHESRDQSLFIDDDNTAYLLSATNMNQDINIYKLDATWTKPVSLVNTICKGGHRETPLIIKQDGEYYFFSSKASGWYPSQAMYCSTTDLAGKWTPLRPIGNNSTFGAQFNNIQRYGINRKSLGMWSYHWGAQFNHKDKDGNYPRIATLAFNRGFAAANYFSYVEFSDKNGLIPVQDGRNLTLSAPVTANVKGAERTTPDCITDGAALDNSKYFKGLRIPYSIVIDMQKKGVIKETHLATRLINGSEGAYKYTIEGSNDNKSFTLLINGNMNWTPGFVIDKLDNPTAYRYLRLKVWRVVSVHKNNEIDWADGIYEFTAFGEQQ